MNKKILGIVVVVLLAGIAGAVFFMTRGNSSDEVSTITTGCGAKGVSCLVDEIAKHNTASDCWVIYKGNYYNVTSYVSRHEGGAAVFNDKTCGQDIQKYLEGEASSAGRTNNHPSTAYRDLEKLLIGPVATN